MLQVQQSRQEREAPVTPADKLAVVNGRRYFWTNHEEKTLRETYPTLGPQACVPLLPRRSLLAIYQYAVKLGLKSPRTHDFPRQRWWSNDHIDAAIRRCYQSKPTSGAVNALARRLGRPRYWVGQRARKLGLVMPRFKEPPWSEDEVDLLHLHAHKEPATIMRIFKTGGFTRSATAILVKRNRLDCDTEDPNHCTATGLSKLMGVDAKTVTGWIAKGWLKADRRGTERTPVQGGDMWWIRYAEVRRFVVDNAVAVDIRKVDKFWFIDLLAGGTSS